MIGRYLTSLHDQVRHCSKHRSDHPFTGFDRWSFNSYSKLGTKQGGYYPEFFKNNVSDNPSCEDENVVDKETAFARWQALGQQGSQHELLHRLPHHGRKSSIRLDGHQRTMCSRWSQHDMLDGQRTVSWSSNRGANLSHLIRIPNLTKFRQTGEIRSRSS